MSTAGRMARKSRALAMPRIEARAAGVTNPRLVAEETMIRALSAAGLVLLASTVCGGAEEESPQTVTAIGLFELELPEGWSVIVPTATDEDLSPVLSVGTTGQPVEERVGVVFFDGTKWDTPEAAAQEWTERSTVALEFEAVEQDGVSRLRDEFTIRKPDGEEASASIVHILSMPGEPDRSWLVVVCGSGPG